MTLNDFYGITGEYENYLFDEKNRTDENMRSVNVGQYRAYTAALFVFYAFFQYVDFLRDIALGDGTNENTAPADTAD